MKSRAAVLFAVQSPLRVLELDIPPLRAGQVLVEVAYSGVCHSQLNEVRGLRGVDRYLPHTLGHEGSGIVLDVGEGVRKVKPGDRVVLSWIRGTGADVNGAIYDSPLGAINSGPISTFMSHTIAAENRVTIIPSTVPLDVAALLGCAVPTGAGIILNTARLQSGRSIAIFGIGGIGLSCLMAAISVGAHPIIAIDVKAEKLKIASEFGATHVLRGGDAKLVETIRDLTSGRGVDLSVEASGHASVMETAFEAVRAGGGLCVVAGNPPVGDTMRVNPFSLIGGKRLVGTWGGESNTDVDIPRYVNMYLEKTLRVERLVGDEYPLSDVNAALEDLRNGNVTRALIRM